MMAIRCRIVQKQVVPGNGDCARRHWQYPYTFSELFLIHASVTIYRDGQDKQDKNMVSECLRFTQIFAD